MGNNKNGENFLTVKQLDGIGRIELPHSDELERCVLGALMVDHCALNVTIERIHDGLFHSDSNNSSSN